MLAVRDLTVRLGELTILRALSLEVPSGATLGLVGRNGAGKTTTLRSIMGLVPASGEVLLDGRNVIRLSSHRRSALGIGYLPEDRRLVSALTVEDNLLIPAWAQRWSDTGARLDAILELLPEVGALFRRRASGLSGGQQKLVALARALACARRLLLLDEPMEGVSPALSARMAAVVRAFQEREAGLAVLVAESDLNRARLLTDRILTIERGEVVASS